MKPAVTFPDPERKVIAFYNAAGIASTVSTDFPTATLTDTTKHLQVELEVGGVDPYPVTERAQVRVTCHMAPEQRTAVKAFASEAHGRLLAWAGDADVSATFPRIGRSNVITDPDTENLMVWFTVRVDLKATVLAS